MLWPELVNERNDWCDEPKLNLGFIHIRVEIIIPNNNCAIAYIITYIKHLNTIQNNLYLMWTDKHLYGILKVTLRSLAKSLISLENFTFPRKTLPWFARHFAFPQETLHLLAEPFEHLEGERKVSRGERKRNCARTQKHWQSRNIEK